MHARTILLLFLLRIVVLSPRSDFGGSIGGVDVGLRGSSQMTGVKRDVEMGEKSIVAIQDLMMVVMR